MRSASAHRWMPLLLSATALTTLVNAGMTWHLASRLSMLEAGQAPPAHALADGGDGPLTGAAFPSFATSRARFGAGAGPAQETASAPPGPPASLQRQKALMDPLKAANEMDRLLAQEPTLPTVEQAHLAAVQQAIQHMPADVAQPVGLQTNCRGRRCLVSAGFADDLQANEWAQRLMLQGGKNMPRAARIIAIPLQDGSGAVSLQLYLF